MPPSANPFLNRTVKRGQTGSGRLSEVRVAKALHARLTPNSGAASVKGDMTLGKTRNGKGNNFSLSVRLEAKSTKALTMPVDYAWLTKIAQEAQNTRQTPALSLSFTGDNGSPRPYGDWVAIPMSLFRELLSALECADEED